MTADLVPYPGDNGVARWVSVLVPAAQLAERIAGTEFVPAAMRGKPDVVTAAIMYGDEIGIGPMQALAGIHVVEGRPSPSAELLRAMILRDGHSLVVHEMTGTRARVSGLRKGQDETARTYVEWTLDMARAAGLLGRQNWQRYPRAMLLARASGDLARLVFPDVVKGLGIIAEDVDPAALESWGPPGDEAPPSPTTQAAPRKAVQRRTRPRKAPKEPPVAPPPERPWHGPETEERAANTEAWNDRQVPAREIQDTPLPVEDPPVPEPEPAALEPPPDANPRPETRDDAPPPPKPPKGPGPQLVRAVQASLGRALGRGPDSEVDRADRLALESAIVGREITSTLDLTRPEAMRVLDVLAAIQAGEATWETDESGELRILDLREPPPEEPSG